jgi:hypothetical protein
LARATGEGWICQNWTIWFSKSDTLIFSKTSDCALARLSSNRAGEPRRGSLIIHFEALLCSRFDRKVRQHILVTPLGNRFSLAMTHYGMGIYNNNAIMTHLEIIVTFNDFTIQHIFRDENTVMNDLAQQASGFWSNREKLYVPKKLDVPDCHSGYSDL